MPLYWSKTFYSQHDGVTANTTVSMEFFLWLFQSVICQNRENAWPAWSSDLIVLDCFLWRFSEKSYAWEYYLYLTTDISHCRWSNNYWWEGTVKTFATMHWCQKGQSVWCNFQKWTCKLLLIKWLTLILYMDFLLPLSFFF